MRPALDSQPEAARSCESRLHVLSFFFFFFIKKTAIRKLGLTCSKDLGWTFFGNTFFEKRGALWVQSAIDVLTRVWLANKTR